MPSNCGAGVLLRIPQTTRRSNHSILKEVNPEYSLEELMLKLNLQYFGHLLQRVGYDWVSEQQMLVWSSKNWCFWIVVLEKTLKSPLECEVIKRVNSKGNQTWIWLMLKLKLQCFVLLVWRADSLENTLMLGNIEGKRRRLRQRMR